jgi:hypothetical protein
MTAYYTNIGVTESVSVTVTLSNGKSSSASVSFAIKGPTGTLLPTVNMLTDGSGVVVTQIGTLNELTTYGPDPNNNNSQVGITFNEKGATAPSGRNQAFTFVQILNNNSVKVINSPGAGASDSTNWSFGWDVPLCTRDQHVYV